MGQNKDENLDYFLGLLEESKLVYDKGNGEIWRYWDNQWGWLRNPRRADANSVGYRVVCSKIPNVGRVSVKVHRLIWTFYNGPIPENYQINHIDGNKANNVLSNIAIVTQSENMQHAYRTGLNVSKFGEVHHSARLSEETVQAIRILAQSGTMKHKDIAAMYNISMSHVSQIRHSTRRGRAA